MAGADESDGDDRTDRPEPARRVEQPAEDLRGQSDDDLVADVVDGSQSALAALYDRYSRRTYSLARRLCGDDGLAEEVVQEVFLSFWKAPHRFDPARGAFSTWILTLVHHRSVDAVRREASVRRHTVPATDDGEEWSAATGPGADQDALESLTADEVRTALRALPDEQRRALSLAYFGGYTQSEIAGLTGAPIGTVKSRMFTGIKRLRAVLEPLLASTDTTTVRDVR
ncbi:RNA polymerase sigma factor [Pseudonocardia sp. CA-107938]|uniref:RNA polymerase sigma factor n=1 Tax=Pseudonocardia sp. CA-107938 TaxID=3240021 RepID=UPI003D919229